MGLSSADARNQIAQALVIIRADGSLVTSDIGKQKPKVQRGMQRLGTVGGQAFSRAFGAAGVLGVGLAFQKIANMGEQFNRKMRNSLAIMGDVSVALREDMVQASLKAASVTQFSSAQTAESFFFLASAGLDAQQSIAAMPAIAQFAQAGMFDLSRATSLAADAQAALGLKVKDPQKNLENMVRITDVLTKANTMANASIEQFSQSLTTKAGAAAKVSGIELEEIVAVLAALADQGTKAHDAGTAVNIILRDLKTKAIDNAEAFERYNVSVFDATGKMNNLADIVADIERAFIGANAKQKQMILSTLGFIDKSKIFIQSIIGTSEKIRKFEEALRVAGGMTIEVADKQLTPFQKAVAKIGVEFTKLGKTIIESLTPTVKVIGDNINLIIKLAAALGAATGAWIVMGIWIKRVKILQIAYNAVQVTTTLLAHALTGTLHIGFVRIAAAIAGGVIAFVAMERALGGVGEKAETLEESFEKLNGTMYTLTGNNGVVQRSTREFIRWTEEANKARIALEKLEAQRKKEEEAKLKAMESNRKLVRVFGLGIRDVVGTGNEPLPPGQAVEDDDKVPEFIKWNLAVDWEARAAAEKKASDALIPFQRNLKRMAEASKELGEIMSEMVAPEEELLNLGRQLNEIVRDNPDLQRKATMVWREAFEEVTGFSDAIRDMQEEYTKLTTNMGDNEFAARKLIIANKNLLSVQQKMFLLQRAIAQDKFIERHTKGEERRRVEEQKKQQAAQTKKQQLSSLFTSLQIPVVEAKKQIALLTELERQDRLSPEMKLRGIQQIKSQLEPQKGQVSGRMGFAAFGMAVQDALLQGDTAKMSLREAQETNRILGILETKEGEVIAAIKEMNPGLPEGQ